jgi:5-methylcytosine-specific restriction endonuclease McrA
MTERREFSLGVKLEIIHRATDENDRVLCEKCGLWVKTPREFEIDHVISEGMRPLIDRQRRLTPADGQLLCMTCHGEKTAEDAHHRAKAKRVEARAHGLKVKHKRGKGPLRVAFGLPEIARRFGLGKEGK